MSRGNDADIDANRRLAADTVELAFREDAQKPGLEWRRHVADFVEKEGATVRLFEASATLRVSAGERAFS